MDQPGLDPSRHVHALQGLARINFWSGSAGILWPPLKALARRLGTSRLRVLDIASGAGDVPLRLWRRARRAGLDLQIEGCDISPVAVEHAHAAADQASAPLRFFVLDALQDSLPEDCDVVMSSLFMHHLEETRARQLLRRMASATRHLVLINDLVRSWSGLWLARLGTRLLSTSDVVHYDGPRSVEGAFTLEEVRALAEKAGLAGAEIRRRWPCRYLLTWSRP
jgi:SAM-dependent methyltransferase